jgi:hypothetical protein
MKQVVKVINENNIIQECAVLRGCHMEDGKRNASLALALLYATGNEDKLYVMDVDFVKLILKDISELNAVIHKTVITNRIHDGLS